MAAPNEDASWSEMTDPFEPVSSRKETGADPLMLTGTTMAPCDVKLKGSAADCEASAKPGTIVARRMAKHAGEFIFAL